jgi:hypothetical protein
MEQNRTVGLRQKDQNSHHAEIPIQNSQSRNKCTPVCNKSYCTYRLSIATKYSLKVSATFCWSVIFLISKFKSCILILFHFFKIFLFRITHVFLNLLSEARINLSCSVFLPALKPQTVFYSKLNSVALVRERTIPTERPPPVGEVSANFCG